MSQWNITIKKSDHVVACHNVAHEITAIKELVNLGFNPQRVTPDGVYHYHRPVRRDGDRVLPGLHGEIREIGAR